MDVHEYIFSNQNFEYFMYILVDCFLLPFFIGSSLGLTNMEIGPIAITLGKTLHVHIYMCVCVCVCVCVGNIYWGKPLGHFPSF
jgi:hypothetical protein